MRPRPPSCASAMPAPSETAFPRAVATRGAGPRSPRVRVGARSRVFAGLIDVSVLVADRRGDPAIPRCALSACRSPDVFCCQSCRSLCSCCLLNGGYLAIFTAAGGQTIGKMLAGIRVVADPSPADPESRLALSASPLGAAVLRATRLSGRRCCPPVSGFAAILFDADGRALHDRLAETRVVKA